MNQKGFSSGITLVVLAIIIIGSIAIYFSKLPDNSQKDNTSQVDSPTWENYSDSEFDISFKYPSDWEVVTGNAQNGTFDFECFYISEFLKQPDSCVGLHKSPEVVIKPKYSDDKGLILWGPTSGLGGGCPECTVNNTEVTINNSKYVIPVKIAPTESTRDKYSTFPDGGVYINETGDKSIWSKFDLEFSTNSKETYEIILDIVESIKPNRYEANATLISKLSEKIVWKYYVNNTCGVKIKYPDFFEISENGCEIAIYFGNANSEYTFCPLVHLVINDQSCGSLAYKGSGSLANTSTVNVGGVSAQRSDIAVNGIILESNFEEIKTDSGKTINLSYYNGGKTIEETEAIRGLLNEMVQSIQFN